MSNTPRELRIDLLLGRTVWSGDGRKLGTIQGFDTHRVGTDEVVSACLVGSRAALLRFARGALLAVLPVSKRPDQTLTGYRVPWDRLDIASPARYVVSGPIDELRM